MTMRTAKNLVVDPDNRSIRVDGIRRNKGDMKKGEEFPTCTLLLDDRVDDRVIEDVIGKLINRGVVDVGEISMLPACKGKGIFLSRGGDVLQVAVEVCSPVCCLGLQ